MSWLAVLCLVGVIAICSAAPQAALKWSHLEPAEELHNWNLSPEAVDAAFAEFKLEHERKYESESEEMLRKAIFTQHLKTINMHNYLYSKGLKTYTMGVNKYTDLSHKEFVAKMNGWGRRTNSSGGSTYLSPNVKIDLPDMVDWRDKGYVTPVKDQKDCGSCWAFSTTGSLEGQHFRKTGKLVSLSEQNLVDCSKGFGNKGCDGGVMDDAFEYIKSNNGIDTEESYPYEAKDDTCRYKAEDKGATDTGFVDIPRYNESKLQEAVATVGPVSVAIDASQPSFQMYKNGIYNEGSCSSDFLDHGVLVVGYGTLNGADYWLVKNSWGTSWGEKGYIYMTRNKNNQCGIATEASYPIV